MIDRDNFKPKWWGTNEPIPSSLRSKQIRAHNWKLEQIEKLKAGRTGPRATGEQTAP